MKITARKGEVCQRSCIFRLQAWPRYKLEHLAKYFLPRSLCSSDDEFQDVLKEKCYDEEDEFEKEMNMELVASMTSQVAGMDAEQGP